MHGACGSLYLCSLIGSETDTGQENSAGVSPQTIEMLPISMAHGLRRLAMELLQHYSEAFTEAIKVSSFVKRFFTC